MSIKLVVKPIDFFFSLPIHINYYYEVAKASKVNSLPLHEMSGINYNIVFAQTYSYCNVDQIVTI